MDKPTSSEEGINGQRKRKHTRKKTQIKLQTRPTDGAGTKKSIAGAQCVKRFRKKETDFEKKWESIVKEVLRTALDLLEDEPSRTERLEHLKREREHLEIGHGWISSHPNDEGSNAVRTENTLIEKKNVTERNGAEGVDCYVHTSQNYVYFSSKNSNGDLEEIRSTSSIEMYGEGHNASLKSMGDLLVYRSPKNNLSDNDSDDAQDEDVANPIDEENNSWLHKVKENQSFESKKEIDELSDTLFSFSINESVKGQRKQGREHFQLQRQNKPLLRPTSLTLSRSSSVVSRVSNEVHTSKNTCTYECPRCDTVLLSAIYLEEHYFLEHLEVTSIRCFAHGCSFVCSSRAALRTHTREVHLQLHKCDICGKGYTMQSTLLEHKRSHAACLHCSLCTYSFSTDAALCDHMERVHLQGKVISHKPRKLAKYYVCKLCKLATTLKDIACDHCEEHMINNVNKETAHCSICDLKFISDCDIHFLMHTVEDNLDRDSFDISYYDCPSAPRVDVKKTFPKFSVKKTKVDLNKAVVHVEGDPQIGPKEERITSNVTKALISHIDKVKTQAVAHDSRETNAEKIFENNIHQDMSKFEVRVENDEKIEPKEEQTTSDVTEESRNDKICRQEVADDSRETNAEKIFENNIHQDMSKLEVRAENDEKIEPKEEQTTSDVTEESRNDKICRQEVAGDSRETNSAEQNVNKGIQIHQDLFKKDVQVENDAQIEPKADNVTSSASSTDIKSLNDKTISQEVAQDSREVKAEIRSVSENNKIYQVIFNSASLTNDKIWSVIHLKEVSGVNPKIYNAGEKDIALNSMVENRSIVTEECYINTENEQRNNIDDIINESMIETALEVMSLRIGECSDCLVDIRKRIHKDKTINNQVENIHAGKLILKEENEQTLIHKEPNEAKAASKKVDSDEQIESKYEESISVTDQEIVKIGSRDCKTISGQEVLDIKPEKVENAGLTDQTIKPEVIISNENQETHIGKKSSADPFAFMDETESVEKVRPNVDAKQLEDCEIKNLNVQSSNININNIPLVQTMEGMKKVLNEINNSLIDLQKFHKDKQNIVNVSHTQTENVETTEEQSCIHEEANLCEEAEGLKEPVDDAQSTDSHEIKIYPQNKVTNESEKSIDDHEKSKGEEKSMENTPEECNINTENEQREKVNAKQRFKIENIVEVELSQSAGQNQAVENLVGENETLQAMGSFEIKIKDVDAKQQEDKLKALKEYLKSLNLTMKSPEDEQNDRGVQITQNRDVETQIHKIISKAINAAVEVINNKHTKIRRDENIILTEDGRETTESHDKECYEADCGEANVSSTETVKKKTNEKNTENIDRKQLEDKVITNTAEGIAINAKEHSMISTKIQEEFDNLAERKLNDFVNVNKSNETEKGEKSDVAIEDTSTNENESAKSDQSEKQDDLTNKQQGNNVNENEMITKEHTSYNESDNMTVISEYPPDDSALQENDANSEQDINSCNTLIKVFEEQNEYTTYSEKIIINHDNQQKTEITFNQDGKCKGQVIVTFEPVHGKNDFIQDISNSTDSVNDETKTQNRMRSQEQAKQNEEEENATSNFLEENTETTDAQEKEDELIEDITKKHETYDFKEELKESTDPSAPELECPLKEDFTNENDNMTQEHARESLRNENADKIEETNVSSTKALDDAPTINTDENQHEVNYSSEEVIEVRSKSVERSIKEHDLEEKETDLHQDNMPLKTSLENVTQEAMESSNNVQKTAINNETGNHETQSKVQASDNAQEDKDPVESTEDIKMKENNKGPAKIKDKITGGGRGKPNKSKGGKKLRR